MNRKSVLVIPLCCIAALLIWTGPARAATTVSCSPAIGATGISPNTQIIFTFSSTMVPAYATVMFSNLTANTYLFLPPGSWTAGNTVLTFIPVPSLPANSVISWEVFGVDATFQELAGTTSGTFTTGTGSGGNGSGTNAFTTFQVGKAYYWNQYSAAAPVPDTSAPCFFSDTTALASNRTALNISLTLPTTISNNLTRNPVHQESYYFFDSMISSNAFEAAYPQGNYTFFVSAAASNQTVQVVLPAGMTQPNPPHVNNFLAAQSLNATQAFTLGWDPFVGGTSTDFISVSIGANVWKTADAGEVGALTGTATSVTIPANSLQANSNYTATIGFYHVITTSNAIYVTVAYRATATEFTVNTSSATRPVVTNVGNTGGHFSFDVLTTAGQTFTVVSSPNCALPIAQWSTVLTTNRPETTVHVIDPRPMTGQSMFYRVRSGT